MSRFTARRPIQVPAASNSASQVCSIQRTLPFIAAIAPPHRNPRVLAGATDQAQQFQFLRRIRRDFLHGW
jgi:hypothetical protein